MRPVCFLTYPPGVYTTWSPWAKRAAWGIFTYLSMLFLGLVSILFPNHPLMLEVVLYGVGGSFELVLGLWLVFKGVDLQQWEKYA
jgi:hypothetical protein